MSLLIFFLIAGFLFFLFRASLNEQRYSEIADCMSSELLLKEILVKKEATEADTVSVKALLSRTARVYEAARDICTSLDEGKLVAKFKDDLKKLMNYQECQVVTGHDLDVPCEEDSLVIPLSAEGISIGFLVIRGVLKQDYPFLNILAVQLALGLRRAQLCRAIQEKAITDSLTGLYTKRYAFDRFDEEFSRSRQQRLQLAFLMVDIDDFKDCNDKYGHLVGDTVLCEVARRIKESIREVDMLARFGGEEFAVFIPNAVYKSVLAIAERIRSSVESLPIYAYDEVVRVTVSIGLSSYSSDIKEPSDLIDRADLALYQAKRTGKNKVCIL
ncbi:MAG: GGDEF domain-containing protein [Candidatus Omnitrophota bacterium]